MTNIDLIDEWVTALESGTYNQGCGALKRQDEYRTSYCCLGVLCEVAKDKITGNWVDYEMLYGLKQFNFYGTSSSTDLPYYLTKEIGITAEQRCELMKMNDEEKKTFNEIAAFIEKEIKPSLQAVEINPKEVTL